MVRLGCVVVACCLNGLRGELGSVGTCWLQKRQTTSRSFADSPSLATAEVSSCAPLKNKGTHFTLEVEVGTPVGSADMQKFDLVADTGSDSVIVRSCVCKSCQYPEGTEVGDKICFMGTNRSSSFDLREVQGKLNVVQITFGSGTIQAVVASDIVNIAGVTAKMNQGLLLMTGEALKIPGGLEGILGLGLPRDDAEKKDPGRGRRHRETAAGGAEGKRRMKKKIQDMIKAMIPGLGRSSGNGASTLLSSPSSSLAQVEDAMIDHGDSEAETVNPVVTVKQMSFLQTANITRFSMCFGAGENGDGRLTFNSPQPKTELKNVGKMHWALKMSGISVAEAKDGSHKNSIPAADVDGVHLCSDQSKEKGTLMNCGAIPDSGTTMIMSGRQQIDALLSSVCSRWPRCQRNLTALLKAKDASLKAAEKVSHMHDPFGINRTIVPGSLVVQLLLADCDSWLPKSMDGAGMDAFINKEMPALQFQLQGGDNETQNIELRPEHYVIEQLATKAMNKTHPELASLLQGQLPTRVCIPALAPMDYVTQQNGPVWILGTPLFYAYEVGYGLASKTMSFTESSCKECVTNASSPALVSKDAAITSSGGLRRIQGTPRLPSFDTSSPL